MVKPKAQIDKILNALTTYSDSPISVARLADRSGVAKSSVSKRIYDLRELGYEIDSFAKKVASRGVIKTYYQLAA